MAPAMAAANDPFVLRNNYGPLDYDHTHILNLTYNWNLPSPIHSSGFAMHLAGGAVNGWQLSGYTAFQSGGPIQGKLGTALNAQYPSGLTVPTVQHPDLPDNSYLMPNGLRATCSQPIRLVRHRRCEGPHSGDHLQSHRAPAPGAAVQSKLLRPSRLRDAGRERPTLHPQPQLLG